MGSSALLPIVLLSSMIGAIIGGAFLALRGHDRATPIPFGPFIAAAGWAWFIGGPTLLSDSTRMSSAWSPPIDSAIGDILVSLVFLKSSTGYRLGNNGNGKFAQPPLPRRLSLATAMGALVAARHDWADCLWSPSSFGSDETAI